MFDIGFWELALIMVVALLVLGPERLPRAARTAGLWVGKARQMLASVKADIDRELQAEELKAMMDKRANVPEIQDLVQEVNKEISLDADAPAKPAGDSAAPPAAGDAADKTAGTIKSSPEATE